MNDKHKTKRDRQLLALTHVANRITIAQRALADGPEPDLTKPIEAQDLPARMEEHKKFWTAKLEQARKENDILCAKLGMIRTD